LQPKIINTQNVRQSLDYVARGEVDAGFVYATDAAVMPGRVRVAAEVATPTPIAYPVASIKDNKQAALARRFIAFLQSDAGQAILSRHGFLRP
jgi:molybdate transport system substrate-binding protein